MTDRYFQHWRKYLDECYTDLPGVRKLRKFLIVQGEGSKVLFHAGKRCYNPHTQSAPLRKTHTSSTDVAAVSYCSVCDCITMFILYDYTVVLVTCIVGLCLSLCLSFQYY